MTVDISAQKADLRRAITRDNSADFKIINGVAAEHLFQTVNVLPRANFRFDFPSLEATSSLQDLAHLQGLIDLDQVVVITGFAEVGPWGSSRTRWEVEARGEFTIEGCIEMAWIMDRCMLDGLTVKLMNLLTTKRSKVGMKWISCSMLASVLSVSTTSPFYNFNLTLPFRI